jgi:SAM-dependent methyltransferase
MQLSYDDLFKYSYVLNPISSRSLFLAGKLAELNPKKKMLDLGSGKGYPTLLWASVFGVKVEGYDLNKNYVEYANSHARLLNLSKRVRYFCGDVRELKFIHKYDVVSSLGLGVVEVYGAIGAALKTFRGMLRNGGFLIFGEPVWLMKPVPQHVQETLETREMNFKTQREMDFLFDKFDFKVIRSIVSSEEDWECYVRPVKIALLEIMETHPKLSTECQRVIDGFDSEYQAVKRYWDMILWVVELH